MSSTNTSDYGKVFNSLCHFLALSQTIDTKAVLDNLVASAIALDKQTNTTTIREISEAVEVYFSTYITDQDLIESIKRLVSDNKLVAEQDNNYRLQGKIVTEVNRKAQSSESLENRVKEEWFEEIANIHNKQMSEGKVYDLSSLWKVLQIYLAKSFYRHGAQTSQIFDPTFTIDEKASENLSILLQYAMVESGTSVPEEIVKNSIRHFLGSQTPNRVAYLAELLDGTFTFFALNMDDAISNYLTGVFQPIKIFLDTNFIFGILNLHNNPLVAISHELIDVISQNFPQITLHYHAATVEEMQRTIDYLGEQLIARTWNPPLSRAGIRSNQLTGLILKYHEENAQLETPLDPKIFLQKYQNPDPILIEKGFHIYEAETSANIQIKGQLIAEYKSFIENRRYPKSYRAYDHDMVVLLAAEENRNHSSKYSVLEAGALILTCDYYFYSFDHYVRTNGKVGSVVLPNHLLQMLRPLVPQSADFDERFVATFAIPEFRSIDSDYAATVSKVMMYLSTFTTDLSEESAVRILGDNILIQELSGVDESSEDFANSVENALARENEGLLEEITTLNDELLEIKTLAEQREAELRNQELQNKQITQEKQNLEQEASANIEKLERDKEESLREKQEELNKKEQEHQQMLMTIKSNLDQEARKYARKRLLMFIFGILITSVVLIILIKILGWEAFEPFSYVIAPLLYAGSYLYFAITLKEFSPRDLYERWVDKKKQKFHITYGVNLEKIKTLEK